MLPAICGDCNYVNTSLGIKSIERFSDLAAPDYYFNFLLDVCITLADNATSQGKAIWSWVESPTTGMASIHRIYDCDYGEYGILGNVSS